MVITKKKEVYTYNITTISSSYNEQIVTHKKFSALAYLHRNLFVLFVTFKTLFPLAYLLDGKDRKERERREGPHDNRTPRSANGH